jgi:hypothetical protein
MRDARRRLAAVLDGVGEGPTIVQTAFGLALHARRSLSASEIAMLSPAWLAIPARDEFAPNANAEPDL